MNCCDVYGNCRRGRDCPARRDTSINGDKLKRIEITTPGMHSSKAARIKASAVPPEAGNFRIIDLGPDDADGQPLGHAETMALVWALAAWLVALVCAVGAVALGIGYGTERWADVLWAFLQGAA